MSLGERSLDQLARVRRLLQRFAAPDPTLRMITLDIEAHAAAIEPDLAVLDPAPFGGLGHVNTPAAPAADGALGDRRTARPAATSTDVARRQRRQEMLKPSKLPHASKMLVPGVTKPTSSSQPQLPTQHATGKHPDLNAISQNKMQPVVTSNEGARDQNKNNAVRKQSAVASNIPDKRVIAFPVATSKLKSTQPAEELSDAKIELDTLVHRVFQMGRHPRNSDVNKRESLNEPSQPSALPPRARLHHGAVIQQRPLAPAVVLPISPASKSPSPGNAVVVTQHGARSNVTELGMTSHALNKREKEEPGRTQPAKQPRFFFNALERREVDESEESLTDRIDQVLREQARRQGVDLT